MFMQTKNDYERFVEVFEKRYREEIKLTREPTEREMLTLYFEYKGSGKTPDEWLEQQELS
jgi:hypothetical protein